MKRLLATVALSAAIGIASLSGTAAADMARSENGGLRLNGLQLNGFSLNGFQLNGHSHHAGGGAAPNPFAGLDGVALGQ